MAKELDRGTFDVIRGKLAAGTPRAKVAEETGQPAYVVGKVAAALGIAKTTPEVRAADKATVTRWLGGTFPAARPRKPTTRKAKSRRRAS